MSNIKKSIIKVQGAVTGVLSSSDEDFICLTDMAKKFGGDDLIYQ